MKLEQEPDYVTLHTLSYREVIPKLWGMRTFCRIIQNNQKYATYRFLNNIISNQISRMDKPPKDAVVYLRGKNRCSYCDKMITDEKPLGDHVIAQKRLDDIRFIVPCCKACNSSKGKKDLLEWWVSYHNRDFFNLDHAVFSTYIRGIWIVGNNEGFLDDIIPEVWFSCANHLLKRIPEPLRYHWRLFTR